MQDEKYNASFDYARLLAVIGIIWFHAKAPGAVIGYSGLAFFVLLTVHFALPQISTVRDQADRAPAITRYAAARALRLLVPWAIASAFYGGLKMVEVFAGAPFHAEFTTDMWLTGTAVHLWFLPFIFLVSVALWPIGRALPQLALHLRLWAGLGCGGLALACLALAQTANLPVPFAQWAYAGPLVLLGLGLTILRAAPAQMAGLLALFLCVALALDLTTGLGEAMLAGITLILCHHFPLRPTAASAWCAKVSFWIYLIHPAVLTLLVRGAHVPEGSLLLPSLATLLSLLIVALWETLGPRQLPFKGLQA